jgi:DNA-binding response OmpR family regulator
MYNASQKKRILVAEDEVAIQQVLSFFLKHQDFEVLAASDGQEAIRAIPEFNPHLIILDLGMYPVSGWEVLHWLQVNRVNRPVPVLIMSASVHLADQIRGFEAGAIEYITKPTQPSIIVERVRFLLDLTAEQCVQLQQKRMEEQRQMLDRVRAPQPDEFIYHEKV